MTFDIFAPKEPEGVTIDGNFFCQSCNESVDEAIWDMQKNIATWRCSAGHLSKAEGFL